ncbi:MAG: Jag N-terminal domain-containing protein [Candidatus Eisenbacteria bacterium]|uniref:RNA-binding protein KhpB n=1 Tax=Eiseniibacteriota bacterium TaxID=2212470 RepID=A0A948S1S1_UNCEI|nr:Jag N-terminal domain-containing protein [Candidatus Eisenbacteria bacterium]MBU1950311.1 Jag N-terminal domain-containing protein [Candidatus Eisenbacteria bacterium]MBU2693327.1 Jag N-terminal domain-containing protein [Candidatus Eisenbacteria bacterium]
MQLHPRDDEEHGGLSEKKEVISQGKTLDEAVQRGIEELGIRKEDAEVEVLDVGGSGLMGRIRGKSARVRVRARDTREQKLKEVTAEILQLMEIDADVSMNGNDGNYRIEITSEGADGLLIGRRGETLEALQHIVHRVVAGGEGPLFITVDVSGYRERRRLYLEAKARELASVALSQRREVLSEPLTVGERRIFHSALAEIPYVQARALGEGMHRKIAVGPASEGRERDGRGRSGGYRESYDRSDGERGRYDRGDGDRERGRYDRGEHHDRHTPDRQPPERHTPDRQPPERDRYDNRNSYEEGYSSFSRNLRTNNSNTSRPDTPHPDTSRWETEQPEDSRGIPPAPESAVGREWMRQPQQNRHRRSSGGSTEFLSPSRGFAGSGYSGGRRQESNDMRQRRETRGTPNRKPSIRPREDENGGAQKADEE